MFRLIIYSTWTVCALRTIFLDASIRARTKQEVDICVLVPYDDSRLFSFHRVIPAVDLAVEKVKATGQVSGVKIRIRFGNTGCNSRDAPIVAFEYYRRQQVSVFIGPVCDYSLAPVARYAPVWNIPVITPGGFAHDMVSKQGPDGEFPTLTRVGVTFNSLADSLVATMMGIFRWSKIKVIYDGEALSDVMPRFCYLAAASLVNTTKEKRMGHDFHMFLPGSHSTTGLLLKEVGNDFGNILDWIMAIQDLSWRSDYRALCKHDTSRNRTHYISRPKLTYLKMCAQSLGLSALSFCYEIYHYVIRDFYPKLKTE